MGEFKPVLRFIAVSDIHYMTEDDRSDVTIIMPTQQADLRRCVVRLHALFDSAYAYAARQPYNRIDAFLMAGDQTDDGTPKQLRSFYSIVKEKLRSEESRLLVVNGNHEFYDAGESRSTSAEHLKSDRRLLAELDRRKLMNYCALRFHTVLNGYHFLGFSPTCGGGRNTSDPIAAWLDRELAAAVEAGGKTRPVFVMHHHQTHDTVCGSPSAASIRSQDNIRRVLAKYPQVVDIAGHTHATVDHPNAVWQGEFTAINTGTLSFCGSIRHLGLPTNTRGGFQASGHGDPYDEYNEKETAEYTICELDADNRLRLLRVHLDERDDVTPVVTTERILNVGDASRFDRSEEEALARSVPCFPAGAALSPDPVQTPTSLQIKIPQALCAAFVEVYRCELCRDGELLQTVTRLSGQYRRPVPDCVVPFTGLKPGTTYTVKVFPISTMDVEGRPLEGSFTTAAQPDPLVPDVFSAQFRADGSAINAVNGDLLVPNGETEVSEGRAVFRGAGDLQWRGIEPYYELFRTGFTFALRARLTEAARGSFLAGNFAYHIEPAGTTQLHGGFGFKWESDGRLSFYLLTSSKDVLWSKLDAETLLRHAVTTKAALEGGGDVQLAGTYDGQKIAFYVDGESVGSIDRPGALDFPQKKSCQYLSLGGDSGLDFRSSDFTAAEIESAAIFSSALTPEQIKLL